MDNINLDKIIKVDELDYNMILSVPESIGTQLQKIIQGHATQQEKESTQIEIGENTTENMDIDDSRKMIFKMNGMILPATIVDLPCIIEANKTIDYKTFYKSSDISQMIYVHDKNVKLDKEEDIANFDPLKSADDNFLKCLWKKDYDNKYKFKHGIAKCSRDIRSRRFKRKIRYNHEEILEVAKKLKSIIDNGAANFENQMKNKESQIEDENNTIKNTIDNQSVINSHGESITDKKKKKKVAPLSSSKKKGKKDEAHEFISPLATDKKRLSLSISLPIHNDLQEVNNVIDTNLQALSQEEQQLVDQYMKMKEDYKRVKSELQSSENKDREKIKYKKMLKKSLKLIKEKLKSKEK